MAYSKRSPVLRWSGEAGLEWEDVYFPSADGTALEGWFIPCLGSDKLIICSHPFSFSRAGFPSHIESWKSAFGPGNDYEIDFIPDYKILHDHGYNVLAYDFRNYGHSSAANGGLQSNNRFESRDVIGSLAYARSRADLAGMTIGLFSRCMGANATFRALATDPEPFVGVRCLVAPLLLSARVALERMLEGAGLADHADEADLRVQRIVGISLSGASPVDWAPSVTLPTLTYGVRNDSITRPSDLEAIFDAIGTEDKTMFWIDETTRRWDGYTWFQRHPDRILEWFEKYMR
jgi:pimeloyl-ACP methyl ester carboxylesterase